MKTELTVTIDVDVHERPSHSMPAFHEDFVRINDERTDVTQINASAVQPNIWYVFSKDTTRNHGFVATINLFPVIQQFLDAWPELNRAEDAAFDAELFAAERATRRAELLGDRIDNAIANGKQRT